MQVKFVIKNKKAWKPSEIKLAKSAVQFAIQELDLWASEEPLRVIMKGGLSCGSWGDSIDLDTEYVIRVTPNGNWLATIFHEMEHVRQYVDDELELESNVAMWKGELYTLTQETYWTVPWEVKARKAERKLFRKYLKKFLTSQP